VIVLTLSPFHPPAKVEE
jgi:hypothetical protein